MNPLGGLLKVTAAAVIGYLWLKGNLTGLILQTAGAVISPPQPAGATSTSTSTSSSIGGSTA